MIRKLENADFDEVYHIMERSFPEDERRTYSEQKELLNNPLYRIYVSEEPKKHQIQAFLAVWNFDKVAFIEHIAVNPVYRNHGIGAATLNEVVTLLGKMVCLEVEPPDNEMASRRIEFYKRNHFFYNEYTYIQPPISQGRKPVQLFIMTSERTITEREFEDIKNLLYQQVYRVKTDSKYVC